MAFMDTLFRLERLAHLIKRKSTGSREDLAQKMDVSVRTVDNLLVQLRMLCEDDSLRIYYCKLRNSYCFNKEVDIRFQVVMPVDNLDNLTGGRKCILNFLEDAAFLRALE